MLKAQGENSGLYTNAAPSGSALCCTASTATQGRQETIFVESHNCCIPPRNIYQQLKFLIDRFSKLSSKLHLCSLFSLKANWVVNLSAQKFLKQHPSFGDSHINSNSACWDPKAATPRSDIFCSIFHAFQYRTSSKVLKNPNYSLEKFGL